MKYMHIVTPPYIADAERQEEKYNIYPKAVKRLRKFIPTSKCFMFRKHYNPFSKH